MRSESTRAGFPAEDIWLLQPHALAWRLISVLIFLGGEDSPAEIIEAPEQPQIIEAKRLIERHFMPVGASPEANPRPPGPDGIMLLVGLAKGALIAAVSAHNSAPDTLLGIPKARASYWEALFCQRWYADLDLINEVVREDGVPCPEGGLMKGVPYMRRITQIERSTATTTAKAADDVLALMDTEGLRRLREAPADALPLIAELWDWSLQGMFSLMEPESPFCTGGITPDQAALDIVTTAWRSACSEMNYPTVVH